MSLTQFEPAVDNDTFQIETIVEIVHQKQKTASLTVHPVVLLPEFNVKDNEENRQLQEVEQETLKIPAKEDEKSFDDTFQMVTVVEIIHQKQKAAALTVHPVVLLSKVDVQENEENKE